MNPRAGAENFLETLHAEVLLFCRKPSLVFLPVNWFSFRSLCRLVVELLEEQVMGVTGVELSLELLRELVAENSLKELSGWTSLDSLLGFCSEAFSEPETET